MKKGEKSSLKSSTLLHKRKGDIFIPIFVILISLFGILMIYSASYYNAEFSYNDKFFYVKKQVIGFVLGIIGMLFFAFFDYKKIIKIRYIIIFISFILLVLVFTPLGFENYGAKRWIKVGSITIQPSEISKFAFVIFTASYFSIRPKNSKTFKGILPVLLVGGITCLLIMLEPNMSITICVGLIMLSMLFVSGIKIKTLLIIIVPIIILVPLLIVLEPYRFKRLMAFINPWASPKGEGYQLLQSLYALGSGGFFGVGLFNSRQKYRFLPFSESDFILSIIGEELGFIGIIILFLAVFLLFYRGIRVSAKCNTYFGTLLSFGISMVFIIQVFVNALVVSGSIPPTGLPLPLISCGNTSLIVFMCAFGILYNISKDCQKF